MLEHEREEQLDKLRANFTNQKAFEKLKEKMAYKAQQRAHKHAQATLDEVGLQKSRHKN
jgi:flagellar biosynthesis chaperone FliJ